MRHRTDLGEDALNPRPFRPARSSRLAGVVVLTGLLAVAAAGCTSVEPAPAESGAASAGASASDATSAPDAASDSSGEADAEAPPLGGVVPESTPSVPAYTADQLRTTITSSGYGCATWTPATLDQGVGGRCEESMISALVFPDQASLEAAVQRSTTSATPKPFLVGTRWVMTVDHPDGSGSELVAMQDVIGGDLVGPNL